MTTVLKVNTSASEPVKLVASDLEEVETFSWVVLSTNKEEQMQMQKDILEKHERNPQKHPEISTNHNTYQNPPV